MIFRIIKKTVILSLILSLLVVSVPQKSYALWGVGDTVVVVGDVSPTGINNYVNHTMTHLKDFVLDKLATLLAKQILHQLTVSVINWINTGFEGSPAFLTNPGAFFLDAADQVTGAFLATNGPLSALCSPFAIDIRLSLALSQTSIATQRYTCTLGRIIEAQKNGPDIIVNGQVVRSQGSMSGFLAGDFNQGGWPAFIALTTEPQNNPYGAFLSAESDLHARINAQQNVIRADLQLGMGFMSWQSCKDLPGGTIDPENAAQVAEADAISGYGSDPSIRVKKNGDGTVSYQECQTQTPGSVIAGTLQTSLNVPVVELELANSINAVINALITKMVSTMLTGGLGALSGGSGGGPSYTQEVITEINTNQSMGNSISDLRSAIASSLEQVPRYTDQYGQAITLITESKNKYLSARACFASKSAYGNAGNRMSEIDLIISSDIDPLLSKLRAKYEEGQREKAQLEEMLKALSTSNSVNQVQLQSQKYTEYVKTHSGSIAVKINDADTALSEAQTKAGEFNSGANQMLMECSIIY